MYISDAIILNFLMLELIQLASRLTRSTRKWHRGSYKLLGVASHLERYIFNEMGREGKKKFGLMIFWRRKKDMCMFVLQRRKITNRFPT